MTIRPVVVHSATLMAVAAVVLTSACAPLAVGARRQHPLLGAEAGRPPATSSSSMRSPFDDPVPDDSDADRQVRSRLAAAAGATVGDRPIIVGGVRYRFDCSGVAAGIYAKAGLPISGGNEAPSTRSLFDIVRQQGSLRRDHPLPGDLVFFDDTWDANGNGVRDDPLSHVGVVERIEGDGTVLFIHRIGSKIVRWRLNTVHPLDRADDNGHVLNHYLRAAEGAFPAQTTGELFVAFGSLPPSMQRAPPRVADAR